jgi:hypothetical protein
VVSSISYASTSAWRTALAIVQPETVVAWHRRGFWLFWTDSAIALEHVDPVILEKLTLLSVDGSDAAQQNGRVEELHNQLVELANAQNKSADGSTSIPATFLRVTVRL